MLAVSIVHDRLGLAEGIGAEFHVIAQMERAPIEPVWDPGGSNLQPSGAHLEET